METYGYTREEFLSMTFKDLQAKDERPALLIRTPAVGEPLISSPWRHQRKDNSVMYVEITAHALLFRGRKAQLLIANDVTEGSFPPMRATHLMPRCSSRPWVARQTFNAIDLPVLIVVFERQELSGLTKQQKQSRIETGRNCRSQHFRVRKYRALAKAAN